MAAPVYIPRPPSAWVKDKTPEHDRYQGWLMQLLRQGAGGMHPSFLARDIGPSSWKAYLLRRNTLEYRLEAEFEFFRDNHVFAFADVLEQRLSKTGARTITLWEIKPKIESVFGTIRQIKYYRHLATERFPEADYIRFVVACSPDDPLSGLMRLEWKNTVPLRWGWTKSTEPKGIGNYSESARVRYLSEWAMQTPNRPVTSRTFPTDVVAQSTPSDIAAVFQIVRNAPRPQPDALRRLLGRREICRWFSDQECLEAAQIAWKDCFNAPLRRLRSP